MGLVDFIFLLNTKGRQLWHNPELKGLLVCGIPDMDNRRYSEESLMWVLKRDIFIMNFTTRKLEGENTELHYACSDNKAWIAEACIKFNYDDINALSEDIRTPLHLACENAHVDVVELLLKSGASLYISNDGDEVPIHCAINAKRFDTVKLLLSYHEKDKYKEKAIKKLGNAFASVAGEQNLEIVQLFLEKCGPEIIHSRTRVEGHTALHYSSNKSDNTKVMEFLLASGADVNAVSSGGGTPIHTAILYVRPECVRVLLAAGAGTSAVINRVNAGNTVLDMALSDNYRSIGRKEDRAR